MMTKRILGMCFFLILGKLLIGQIKNEIDSLGRKQGTWNIFYGLDSLGYYLPNAEINYRNDTLHGDFKIFDGEDLRLKVVFINGKKEGIERVFDSQNAIREILFYSNGIAEYRMVFDEKGRAFVDYELKGDSLEGVSIRYGKNGQKISWTEYENNLLNGFEYHYNKKGIPETIFEWRNDTLKNTIRN
ncbi:hypothetical protein KFE98_05540 [bacterium SCSIO 12741]|nr:hypothetical protein KFE98_05540 [bacterium SCSIO 12741]